jgi:hypothetical protein
MIWNKTSQTKNITECDMKNWKICPSNFFVVSLLLTFFSASSAYGQITPNGDSYTNTALPTTNFGTKTLLDVQSASQTSYIQFDLSSIPAGYTSANVAKASLKLYVNAVNTSGSFNVNFINGTWLEKTITANLSPALGATIAASVPLTSSNVHDFIIIDVTSAVGAWLDGSQPNDGLALVANSPLNASFDSKESTTNSQPAELDVVLTGTGTGTITGVTTAMGSGLTGGGTKGTLALSLTKVCAANQGLQWNGSSWVCSSAGAGSVTSIALAAPSSDFTVSGSPITGAGTLNLGWTVAPTSSNIANAIVKRDSQGNFGGTAVTATNVISSVVTATTVNAGTVNAATSNAVAITGASSAASAQAIFGHATGTGASPTYGVLGGADGPAGVGVWGYSNGSAGYGVQGKGAQNGVFGWSGNNSSHWNTFASVGAQGDTATSGGVAVLGTAEGGEGGFFINSDTTGFYPTLVAVNTSGNGEIMEADSGITNVLLLDAFGDLSIAGNISKAGGSFKIDHPLDPANKYLYHSFVESPDMMNLYNGMVTLNAEGKATVTLPDWFEALNREFRYQLTAVGAPGPNLYIAEKIKNNHFAISGGQPGAEVSWQVTGVRHDAWAEAHRIPVEVEKQGAEQGRYMHPELFGKTAKEFGIPGRAAAAKLAAQH